VLAPAIFAKQIFDPRVAQQSFTAFCLFCIVASSVYVVNDIRDIDADRKHPTKRNRPIASGAFPVPQAWQLVVVLLLCATLIAAMLPVEATVIVAIYCIVNIVYSTGLKHVPYVDVLIIAFGFVLRVLCGSVATNVAITAYLFATTFLLASYLGFGKRLHELTQHDDAASQRASLAGYSLRALRVLFVACGALTILVYSMYVFSPSTQAYFLTHWLSTSLPFVIFGIARYGSIAWSKVTPESPTEEMLKDPYFILNLIVWGLTMLSLVYFL
jgi:4-hydroxybenzoate polyprenyltransferase